MINCIDNPITMNKKNYLERAAKRLGLDLSSEDWVLNIEPYEFKQGKWTGIWEIDLLMDRPEMNAENWSRADKIYTAISTVPKRLKDFNRELLFQAIDPEIHKRREEIEPIFDVVFIGSLDHPGYLERERIYNLLKRSFDVQIFPKNRNVNEFITLCNKARVQFIRSMKTPIGDGELAQRFWEGLAIGPVLTNWVPDLELTGLIEGQDYLAYRNDEEMIKKLRFLLDNPDYSKFLAENGREKVLELHTYDHRLKTIWNSIPKNI